MLQKSGNMILRVKWFRILIIAGVICNLQSAVFHPAFAGASADKSAIPNDPPSPESLVSQGNTHYMNRQYDLAAKCYAQVIGMGYASADLYYNLGNACYKQDFLAKAILNYEKALLLNPGDEDIRQNLALANARIVDKIDAIPDFFLRRWLDAIPEILSPDGWAITSVFLFVLSLAAFLWFVISNAYPVRRSAFTLGILFLLLTCAGILSMRSRVREIQNSGTAIIMVSSVNARSSPDEQSTNIFVLHEGTKVTLVDSVQNWKEIRIADGNKGWVLGETLEEI
jgi:hypothetical protein